MRQPEIIQRILEWGYYRCGDRMTAGQIASKLHLDPAVTQPALDAMVSSGLLKQWEDGAYTAPRTSRDLLTRKWT